MNTPSSSVPETTSQAIPPPAISPARLLYWSVRRELWENRSIYIAPLCAAGVVLVAFLIALLHHGAKGTLQAQTFDAAKQPWPIERPYEIVAMMILFTSFLTGVFYCLDALHGERRERSILFWKSLPVSDLTTVLSKACIPLVILPPLTFAIIVATHCGMMLMSGAVRLMYGVMAVPGQLSLSHEWLTIACGLFVGALWHAPIYGWMLLVSGWARRATFLWAFLPLIAIQIFEKIAFGTSYSSALLNRHFIGWLSGVFVPAGKGHMTMRPLTTLDPGAMLATPDLWLGLGVAVLLIAATVRLRRYREPI
jgi:ABC-2 type transport system permease protein